MEFNLNMPKISEQYLILILYVASGFVIYDKLF